MDMFSDVEPYADVSRCVGMCRDRWRYTEMCRDMSRGVEM